MFLPMRPRLDRAHFRSLLLVSALVVPCSQVSAAPSAPLMCVLEEVTPHPAPLPYTDAELVLGAHAAYRDGQLDLARAMLTEAATRFPNIHDHVQVMLGEIELEAGDAAAARTRFEAAAESVSPSVRLEARIGRVRALVELGDRGADAAVEALLAEYPELPDRERLAYAEAVSLERRGRLREAAAAFREIDLLYPGSVYADEARARLASLLETGTPIAPLTLTERIDRAERLTATGPVPAARDVVDALLAESALGAAERRTVLRLAVRIARVEGRFSDVDRLEREMRAASARRAAPPPTVPTDDAEAEAELDEEEGAAVEERARRARAGMARVLRRHTLAEAPLDDLDELADYAAGGGLDDALRVIIGRARADGVPAEVRYHVAMAASGRPSFEAEALALLGMLGDGAPELITGARYHRARLLERVGRFEEARTSYRAVLDADRSSGRYYTLWASQRVEAVERILADRAAAREAIARLDGGTAPSAEAAPDAGVGELAESGSRGSRTFDLESPTSLVPSSVDLDALAVQLEGVANPHATTYPWITRAAQLLRVRAIEEARSELFEALVAHRLSSGRSVHRYGLEAVSRGVSRGGRPTRGRGPRVSRRPLDETTRSALADVAAALGDHGTAIAFGGTHRADDRPRAFDIEVLSAARKFDVDPNLLWAVMRVESVYQPRIVSYAGAIGLMQIMPRTGRLIAQQLGYDRFTTAQLLDPAINVEFAAWYLRSLVDRFDGSVPLAVAAYNGGPHNVRLWLERSGPDMPLDAFLERIPFDQTHGYVRRVLTHYAAYRSRDGLPMIDLGVGVPPSRTDPVAF